MVCPCTSHKPPPSSSRAHAPCPWLILSPGLQPGITAVHLRLHQRTWGTGRRDAGRDRLGLHLGPQLAPDVTAALPHATARGACLLPGPTTSCAFASALTPCAPRGLHHLRLSAMAGAHRGVVALHRV